MPRTQCKFKKAKECRRVTHSKSTVKPHVGNPVNNFFFQAWNITVVSSFHTFHSFTVFFITVYGVWCVFFSNKHRKNKKIASNPKFTFSLRNSNLVTIGVSKFFTWNRNKKNLLGTCKKKILPWDLFFVWIKLDIFLTENFPGFSHVLYLRFFRGIFFLVSQVKRSALRTHRARKHLT